MKLHPLAIFTVLFVALPSAASWTLDNDASQVSFVSVKAGDAGEVHRFTHLSGGLADDGAAELEIQLASVDTMIPLRDERMRELLFQTSMFPTATLKAQIDMEAVSAIEPGESRDMSTSISLHLRDQTVAIAADMIVARLGDKRIMVSSRKPVIVNAASVDLVSGIEALREVANLPSISKAVPVSFVLTFDAD